jgi:hypothetical protein
MEPLLSFMCLILDPDIMSEPPFVLYKLAPRDPGFI